jgi:UDP-N-acetyl-D-mannosaminuronate dehydrogenase
VRRTLGKPFRFVELANDINASMPDYVVSRLTRALNRQSLPVNRARILLLGLAYKRNTGDIRESPGVVIAQRLRSLGGVIVVADPHVESSATSLPLVDLTPDEVKLADAVILVTDHDAFDYDMINSCARYILDTRHRMRGRVVEAL